MNSESSAANQNEHRPPQDAIASVSASDALTDAIFEARAKQQALITQYRRRLRTLWIIAVMLFVATFATTSLTAGLEYGIAVMSILLAHEMGHFLQARRLRVPASPPFFIPFPGSPLGTMGAVIVQPRGIANRRQLFDIAVSGPLAGLVLALPIAWWGLRGSEIKIIDPKLTSTEMVFGTPQILDWMIWQMHGTLPSDQMVDPNPLLLAGWVGIFVTALNLLPVGQLDGGHILYTLIGKKSHTVALLLTTGAVCWMAYTLQFGYAVIVVMLLMMGIRHPPTSDDRMPLGRFRIAVGWLTLAFILIGFTPRPIYQLEPETPEEHDPVDSPVSDH